MNNDDMSEERRQDQARAVREMVGQLLKRAQADEPGVDHDAVVDLAWELWFDAGEPGGKDAGPRDRDRAQAWRQIVDARMGEKENEE